jgi:cytoskeleton protein RodZ
MTMSVATSGPGAMLKQRRETLGMSLEQAAAQLNLKAAVIHQLESQQWDARVAPTFIRGYLRHYARLLKLDETDVLAQFDQLLSAMPQPTPMHSFSKKTSRDAAESRFMLATYFLLVLLIGLFLVWFWQTHMLNDQPVSMMPELETATAPGVKTPAVSTMPALTVVAEPSAETISDTVKEPEIFPVEAGATSTVTEVAVTDAAVTEAPVSAAVTAALTATAQSSPVVPVETAVAATEAPQTAAADPATATLAATPTPVATDITPAAPTAGELQLQLQFSAQCWVAVIDANGKRLAYNMQNSGQTLTLTGIGPLKVTLGDPAAVTASLAGKPIDLSGYKQGQVARLTLTGSE